MLGLDFFRERQDIGSSVITMLVIAIYALIAWRFLAPDVVPTHHQPRALVQTCVKSSSQHRNSHRRHHRSRRHRRLPASQAKVADASGSNANLDIYVGRDGRGQVRGSIPLAVQRRTLCAGAILAANKGDFARDDGLTLPGYQVATWGQVDKAGTHVVIHVRVSPRYREVSGFGDYSGIVTLADKRAIGGSVPVTIHVLYPNTSLVMAFAFLAALAGFTWAWLIHDLRDSSREADKKASTYFWRNFILRVAVILAAAIPVVNAQVLAAPGWRGDLTQYIALATVAGAAALALTPTLRALALPPGLKDNPYAAARRKDTGNVPADPAAGASHLRDHS